MKMDWFSGLQSSVFSHVFLGYRGVFFRYGLVYWSCLQSCLFRLQGSIFQYGLVYWSCLQSCLFRLQGSIFQYGLVYWSSSSSVECPQSLG